METLCYVLRNNNTPKMRKLMLECGGYREMWMEFDLGGSDTQRMILDTLKVLCTKTSFVKHFVEVPRIPERMYKIFKEHTPFKEDVLEIALQACPYMTSERIQTFIMPMLSNHMSDNAFQLFLKVLSNTTPGWLNKNKWVFTEIASRLNVPNDRKPIIDTLFTILLYTTSVAKIIKDGIWNSDLRGKLFDIATQDVADNKAQSIMINCLTHMTSKLNFNYELTSDEKACIYKGLAYRHTIYFSTYCCFVFRNVPEFVNKCIVKFLVENNIFILKECTVNIFHIAVSHLLHLYSNNESCDETIMKFLQSNANLLNTSWYDVNTMDDVSVVRCFTKIASDIQAQNASDFQDRLHYLEHEEKLKTDLLSKGISLTYPTEFKCPITQDLMMDPVIASDGHSYEKKALQSFLSRGNRTSPLTREKLDHKIVISNMNLKKRIRDYADNISDIVKQLRT